MPKRFSRGWFLACMIACLNAHPSGDEASRGSTSALGERATSDYDFDDLSAEGYVGKLNDPSVNEESEVVAVSSSGPRKNQAGLPLVPEPDAEMLPAHYTGVKPPGVDHMEIIFIDSASLGSDRKNSLVDATESKAYEKTKRAKSSAGVAAVSGREVSRAVEKRLKGEEGRENRKGEYAESAGKKKARQETQEEFNDHEDESAGGKGASLQLERRREKGRNAAGYRNVYHRDEYKKDADFYDNDHEGGRFRKHGRYDEKHTAAEGDFRKDAGRNAGFAAVGAGKSGVFEDGRNAEEANGRTAGHGRDVRYGKLDEFAKKSTVGAGQSFGDRETGVKVR